MNAKLLTSEEASLARALSTPTKLQREHIANLFSQALQSWQRDWGVASSAETAAIEVQVSGAASVKPVSWRHVMYAENQFNWYWAFVSDIPVSPEGTDMESESAGMQCKAQTTAIPSGIARICNTAVRQADQSSIYEALQTELFHDVAQAIYPISRTSVAFELIEQAWLAWCDQIAAILNCGREMTDPHADWLASPACETPKHALWSGATQVKIPWAGGQFYLELPGELVEQLVATDHLPKTQVATVSQLAEKVAVQTALIHSPVSVRVELEAFELSVGQLQDLRMGDIVRLSHALSEPLRIKTQDGQVLCAGWLGKLGNQVALELTAFDSSSISSSN